VVEPIFTFMVRFTTGILLISEENQQLKTKKFLWQYWASLKNIHIEFLLFLQSVKISDDQFFLRQVLLSYRTIKFNK